MRILLVFVICLTGFSLQADPKSHYMIHCMGCHLADGSGQPPDVPVLDESLGDLIQSDAGRAFLIRVPGAAQAPISDADLAGVINWMLQKYSAESLPEDFVPFSEREVAQHRGNILADPIRFKATLIEDASGTL